MYCLTVEMPLSTGAGDVGSDDEGDGDVVGAK